MRSNIFRSIPPAHLGFSVSCQVSRSHFFSFIDPHHKKCLIDPSISKIVFDGAIRIELKEMGISERLAWTVDTYQASGK